MVENIQAITIIINHKEMDFIHQHQVVKLIHQTCGKFMIVEITSRLLHLTSKSLRAALTS